MIKPLLIPAALTLLLFPPLVSLPAAAHHVHHEVTRGEAVVVSLAYGNGSPLACDRYEIIAEGDDQPFQSGSTDALGRVVFLPDRASVWRVRVFSEDGHGADFTFQAGPPEATAAEPEAVGRVDQAAGPGDPDLNGRASEAGAAEQKTFIERYALPVAGVGIIFGLFGLFSMFVRHRR